MDIVGGRIIGLPILGGKEKALLSEVLLHQQHLRLRPATGPEIAQCLLVDWKITHGGPIFRRHVGDGRPVRQAQRGKTRPEKFDKTPDHAFGAQKTGNGQNQVCCSCSRGQGTVQAHADHFGDLQGIGLAQEHRFGLYPAHAPTHNPQAVDHGGVGVGTEYAVRVENLFTRLLAGGYH